MTLAILGINPTQIDTQAMFALGARGAVDSQSGGVREYIYVSFPVSTAVLAGNAHAINSISGVATQLTSTNGAAGQAVGRRVGISPVAVASNAAVQYGWLQVYGPTLLQATTAIAINTNLTTTATAGQLGAAGVAVTGAVLTAVGVTGTAVAGTLNYPFITG